MRRLPALLPFLLTCLMSVSALAEDPPKEPPKDTCSCDKLICTKDGMRSMDAPCSIKCQEPQTPECQCGKCTESGAIEKRNACHCKSE